MRGNQHQGISLAEPRHIDGLSPRVRGNPIGQSTAGNIAAISVYPRECGGTTALNVGMSLATVQWVYPRECGGTPKVEMPPGLEPLNGGLSPRVRGNRTGSMLAEPMVTEGRSIPASAGEPLACPLHVSGWSCQVYPRECGGTLPYAAEC